MRVPDSGQTIIDGRKLAWRETGNGCPRVFIHEIGGDKGADLSELPDARHMIYIGYPKRFNAALEIHFRRVSCI